MLFKPDEFENAVFFILNWLVIVEFLNSSAIEWTENFWHIFRVKTLLSNFSAIVWTGPRGLLSEVVAIVCSSYCLDYLLLGFF